MLEECKSLRGRHLEHLKPSQDVISFDRRILRAPALNPVEENIRRYRERIQFDLLALRFVVDVQQERMYPFIGRTTNRVQRIFQASGESAHTRARQTASHNQSRASRIIPNEVLLVESRPIKRRARVDQTMVQVQCSRNEAKDVIACGCRVCLLRDGCGTG